MPVIETALTRLLGIEHPILLAPMGSAAGGRLAAAVTHAGGLGLVGSGYASTTAIRNELAEAGNARVGIGFILWALEALGIQAQAQPHPPESGLWILSGGPEASTEAMNFVAHENKDLPEAIRRAIVFGAKESAHGTSESRVRFAPKPVNPEEVRILLEQVASEF